MNRFTLDEDAKSDWYDVIKHHRKKQKGLPALSTLKTDVGNLEAGLNIFNKGSGSIEGPTNNPISGPFGGDVSSNGAVSAGSEGCCESLDTNNEEVLNMDKYEIDNGLVTLRYENIPVLVNNKHRKTFVDWELYVAEEDVFNFLADLPAVRRTLGASASSELTLLELVDREFDQLVDKYINEIQDNFYDCAVTEAQEYYVTLFNDTKSTEADELLSDDEFDLSLRTIV